MVSALFSASGIASRNLQVSLGVLTNPYIGPRGRNDQGFNTGQSFLIADGLSFRVGVLKSCAPATAMNAWLGVRNVTEPRHFCRLDWICNDLF